MLCCPSCGARDIFVETGGFTGMIYRCKRCGYRGPLVVEVDEDTGGSEGKKRKEE